MISGGKDCIQVVMRYGAGDALTQNYGQNTVRHKYFVFQWVIRIRDAWEGRSARDASLRPWLTAAPGLPILGIARL
jgi:hypothetical protein